MQWLYSHRNAAQSTTDRARRVVDRRRRRPRPVSGRASSSARAQPGRNDDVILDDGDGIARGRLERGLAHLRNGRVSRGRPARAPREIDASLRTATSSPRRSTTSISSETSAACAWSAVRQPIRSPRPLTEGTTTERSTAIATAERSRRTSDVSHRFADRPGRDEGKGSRQAREETLPIAWALQRVRRDVRITTGRSGVTAVSSQRRASAFLDEPSSSRSRDHARSDRGTKSQNSYDLF